VHQPVKVAGTGGGDPQVLVYDAKKEITGFFPFTDELQRLFAVQGHPPFIFVEATTPIIGKINVTNVVTQERFTEKR
jgi:hypothetical protein